MKRINDYKCDPSFNVKNFDPECMSPDIDVIASLLRMETFGPK